MNSNKFLEEVKVGKLLRMFAIPCVISLVVQALYNIVDQIFIGFTDGLGELGNTATGIVYPLTVIALALGLLIGDGVASKLSINQGQNNTKSNSKIIASSLSWGLIISVLMLAICLIFVNPILTSFGANSVILPYALDYSTFIILGLPLYIIATIINPIIRADGSPKYAMFSMIVGAITNIILDPICLFVFKMGMNGAALATFIGQLVTFVLSIIYLFRPKTFKLKLSDFVPNIKLLGSVSKLGVSSFLTQITIVIISVINNNIVLNLLPADNSAIGMLTIAFKVYGIVISIVIGVACGGQPIIGYNYGARRFDRVKETFKYIMISTAIVGVVATGLFIFLPKQIFALFGYSDVSDFGIKCFTIYMNMILLTCFTKSSAIFFQSIEKPIKSTVVTMCRDLIFLVPITFIMQNFGVDAFMWSAPISDVLTTILAVIFLVVVFKEFAKLSTNVEAISKSVKVEKSKPGLIITISREHGAGGREIAFELAKKLGIPCYDKELTSIIAKDTGLAVDYINKLESNVSQPMYELYLTKTPTAIAREAQNNVLECIAKNGSCVIVGRCADYILRSYNPYRIFIYANMEYKQNRIMNNYKDLKDTDYENIIKSDKNRARFYNETTGQVWGAKENYDLCINSSIGVEQTVNLIYNYIINRK